MKTVRQALIDEIHYPISPGFVENKLIERGLENCDFTARVAKMNSYKGALADCLASLAQAIGFSESDKSVGNLTDKQRELALRRANSLYAEIGEPLIDNGEPMVIFGG